MTVFNKQPGLPDLCLGMHSVMTVFKKQPWPPRSLSWLAFSHDCLQQATIPTIKNLNLSGHLGKSVLKIKSCHFCGPHSRIKSWDPSVQEKLVMTNQFIMSSLLQHHFPISGINFPISAQLVPISVAQYFSFPTGGQCSWGGGFKNFLVSSAGRICPFQMLPLQNIS